MRNGPHMLGSVEPACDPHSGFVKSHGVEVSIRNVYLQPGLPGSCVPQNDRPGFSYVLRVSIACGENVATILSWIQGTFRSSIAPGFRKASNASLCVRNKALELLREKNLTRRSIWPLLISKLRGNFAKDWPTF